MGAVNLAELANYILPATILIGGGVVYALVKGTYSKENNSLKEDLISTRGQKILDLEADVAALKRRDDDQQDMLNKLRQELNVWRDVPIKQLAEDYHKLAEAMTEMSQLIKTLLAKESNAESRPARRRNT